MEFRERLSWQAHASHVVGLRMHGNWLFSASEDRTVRLWDATTGAGLADFYGHGGGVLSLSVASDKLLWTGSRDHTVRSWDIAEVKARLRENSCMEIADRQSFQYEVAFSRTSAKAHKKSAKGAEKSKA